jgi:hypothetical protein
VLPPPPLILKQILPHKPYQSSFTYLFMCFNFPFTGATNDALYKELWHACAGPLVTLPREGERVYYFPQGHMEQVKVECPSHA